MPPILIAFFILIGATTGPPLVRAVVTRPDPLSRSRFGKPAPQEYRTWTSVPWYAEPRRDTKTCEVTYFALATRGRVVRLLAGGAEQELNSSWSFARTLHAGQSHSMSFEFRDPRSGAQLACQEQSVSCIGAGTETTKEGQCSPESRVPGRKGGKPHLKGRVTPAMALYDAGTGGAFVDVEFRIAGDVDERWYCPRLDVEWPDGTRTMREGDCPPFESRDPEQVFKWAFNRGFPSGEWRVKACISKSGKLLACETVTVRVVGGGE